jgi:hypothetical protein
MACLSKTSRNFSLTATPEVLLRTHCHGFVCPMQEETQTPERQRPPSTVDFFIFSSVALQFQSLSLTQGPIQSPHSLSQRRAQRNDPTGRKVGNPRSQNHLQTANPLPIGLRRRLACTPNSGSSLSALPRFSFFPFTFYFLFLFLFYFYLFY